MGSRYMYKEIISNVSNALIYAGSVFSPDRIDAYKHAIVHETDLSQRWIMELILENAIIAEQNRSPLCDDTGIPHLLIEIGKNRHISGSMMNAIQLGIEDGLRKLPGRPMAVIGDDIQRVEQSGRLADDSGAVEPAPVLIRTIDEDVIRLYIIMQGGGPEIRAKTYRIFHEHNANTVKDEIIKWAIDSVAKLGCTPCTLAIGIGRSHYEAASLMMEAQVYGRYNEQSDYEKAITDKVNESRIGALGLRGKVTVLASFVKVGPQRASGVRIVALRPCCCVEPRIGCVEL